MTHCSVPCVQPVINKYDLYEMRGHLEVISSYLALSIQDTLTTYTYLGQVCGVLGRLVLSSDGISYLLVINRCSSVGTHLLKRQKIYRIERVCALPLFTTSLSESADTKSSIQAFLDFQPCPQHVSNFLVSQPSLLRTVLDIANATNPTEDIGNVIEKSLNLNRFSDKLLEEVLKLFNETNSFYFSEVDLTKRFEQLHSGACCTTDLRFFWNAFLLQDLLEQDDEEWRVWIMPVIQGYIEIQQLQLDDQEIVAQESWASAKYPEVMLISRRSIHRAGTRYIKRGVDKQGHCANFVETEQILSAAGHMLSFLQIRASIPLYWSQPGFKYRPPPVLCKTKQENLAAMKSHFNNLQSNYSYLSESIVVINLIDQIGREKVLSDAFMEGVLDCDFGYLVYVAFDFNDHCRRLKLENVNVLVDSLNSELKSMRFSWLDRNGEFICRQNSLFRVNCVDCLDKTNVIQSAVARRILDTQLRKLGFISSEEEMPNVITLRSMWANNGDALSRQYTGTAALKSDFTRTGQRKLTGIVRDGYNSANRYYLCHVRDQQRQEAIDALLGLKGASSEEFTNGSECRLEDSSLTADQKTQRLRFLLTDCVKLVVPEDETLLASWPLNRVTNTSKDFLDAGQLDDGMDFVIMLTSDSCYTASYDNELDEFVEFDRIPLQEIRSLEMGYLCSSNMVVKNQKVSKVPFVRLGYDAESGKRCYITWRSSGSRLSNNASPSLETAQEYIEYTRTVFDSLLSVLTSNQLNSKIFVNRIARLESKVDLKLLKSSLKSSAKAIELLSQSGGISSHFYVPRPSSDSNNTYSVRHSNWELDSMPMVLEFRKKYLSQSAPQLRIDDLCTPYYTKSSAVYGITETPVPSNILFGLQKTWCSGNVLASTHTGNRSTTRINSLGEALKNDDCSLLASSTVRSSGRITSPSSLGTLKDAFIQESVPSKPTFRMTGSFDLMQPAQNLDLIGNTHKVMKKSQSYTSNVKEKMNGGKQFLRSIGRQVKTFGIDSGARLRGLTKAGFSSYNEGITLRLKLAKQGPFRRYEDRILRSRTKFILL